MHNPKESAIREVNVADHQEEITGSDELSSLPEEYVLDGYGNRWHPKVEPERVQEGERRSEFELSDAGGYSDDYAYPFPKKRRLHTAVAISAAALLVALALATSIRSLSSNM